MRNEIKGIMESKENLESLTQKLETLRSKSGSCRV
jgi:hypothetical protein